MMEKLPVLFRIERRKGGEVTAVFPTLPWDRQQNELTVYAHVGQHGGASFGWYNSTRHRPAKPEEYADLLAELKRIYGEKLDANDTAYELVVYRKMTSQHRAAFNAAK